MSHHHTYYVTSSYILCSAAIKRTFQNASTRRSNEQHPEFSKASSLAHLLYKTTIERTFENVCLHPSPALRASKEVTVGGSWHWSPTMTSRWARCSSGRRVCVSVKRGLSYGKRDLLYAQKRPTDILAYLSTVKQWEEAGGLDGLGGILKRQCPSIFAI